MLSHPSEKLIFSLITLSWKDKILDLLWVMFYATRSSHSKASFFYSQKFIAFYDFFFFVCLEKQQRLFFMLSASLSITTHCRQSLNINVDIFFIWNFNKFNSVIWWLPSERKSQREEKKTLHIKKCGGMLLLLLLMKLDEHHLNLYLFICWMKSEKEREAWKQVPVLFLLLLLLYEAFYYDDIKNVIVLFIHPPPSMWALYVLLIHL